MPPLIVGPPQDWASAVGLFILNYGFLDHTVFEFLEAKLPSHEFECARQKPFKERMLIVRSLLAVQNEAGQTERQDDVFARIDAIRKLRNQIAHGYSLLKIDKDGRTPILTLSLPKEADRMYEEDSQHLTFEQLTEALDQLRKAIENFKEVTGRWTEWSSIAARPPPAAQPTQAAKE